MYHLGEMVHNYPYHIFTGTSRKVVIKSMVAFFHFHSAINNDEVIWILISVLFTY